MSEENKTNSGAPSSDTTSALFVSARKKQLEQQEAERRAKEKEDERLKAEAEVRRLEAEVAERKRRAEEEAQRVAQEEEQSRREAEERRRRAAAEAEARRKEAQKTQAAGQAGGQAAGKTFSMPKLALRKETSVGEKKKFPFPLPFIIGGAAVIVLAVVLVLVLAFGGKGGKGPSEPDFASLLLENDGGWYLNGDTSSYCFLTDGDGGWEIYDRDGSLSVYGYFTVEDDGTIWATNLDDGEGTAALIDFIDENSFYFEDEVFYSEAFSTDTAQYDGDDYYDDYDDYSESALYIDPDATLNDSGVIDGLGMLVRFPDTVFQLTSLTESRLVLASLDDAASVEVAKSEAFSEASWADMEHYRDGKLAKLSTSLPGEITLLDSGLYDDESGITFVYFKLTYAGTYETRYVCFVASLWYNERTGAKNYYDFFLDCPEELTDDYIALFNRIRASRDDA